MDYKKRDEIKNKIRKDIKDIKEFDEVDYFIDAHFQMYCKQGEYDDNSMDLAYHFEMLKEIEKDERFFDKLTFVLRKYIK